MKGNDLYHHPNWGTVRLLEGEAVIAHRDGTPQMWRGCAVVLENGYVLGTAGPGFERSWTRACEANGTA